jgi:lysylphosphatidylglycerol synthetase-like protein (DUF2156 family)
MQSKMAIVLATGGAAIFTFFSVEIPLTWLDFGPRTCTISGCPPQYSIGVILSYMMHYASTLLLSLLGLALMLGGLGEFTRAARKTDGVWSIALGIFIAVIVFSLLMFIPGTVTTATTITSTITSATTARSH